MSDCLSTRAFDRALLIRNDPLQEGIFELVFSWKGPAPLSGQFFLIRPARTSILLGRPISVYGWSPDGDGTTSTSGSLSFLVAARGTGTAELQDLKPGDYAELIGPLGNSWASAIPSPNEDRKPSGLPVALVGGGIGIAPLAYLASELAEKSFDFYAGFRSRPYGMDDLRHRNLVIATEDGSAGKRGRILDLLECANYAAIYACGPEPMLRALAASCKAAGVTAFLSLETRMACGVGACLGCTVRTVAGNRRCCADGPIFNAEEILFDE